MKIYRVVVRGQFADLDEAGRSALLNAAAEHDFLRSAFTTEGTLTYDGRLVVFNVRYEVRDPTDEVSAESIGDDAIERAMAMLDQRGYGYKRLRAEVTDMASMWE